FSLEGVPPESTAELPPVRDKGDSNLIPSPLTGEDKGEGEETKN
ncbi:unnamed protein product, partial [marine sediment metagenome]